MAVADRSVMQPAVQKNKVNMPVETKYLLETEYDASSSRENDAVCNLCQGVFKNERGLKQHLSRTHGVGWSNRFKVPECSVKAFDFEELSYLKHDEIQLKQRERSQDHYSNYGGARRLPEEVTSRLQASRPKVESTHKTPDHIEISKPMTFKSNVEMKTVVRTSTNDKKQHRGTTTTFDSNTGNSVEVADPKLNELLSAIISLQPLADPNDVTPTKDKFNQREAASDICYAINSLTTALNDDFSGSPFKWTCQYAGSQYEITEVLIKANYIH